MKQLVQKLGDGSMEVLDLAFPDVGPGQVLVQNHFSLVSAGTEGGTVKAARKSLLGKAKERPEQAKQVVESLKEKGLIQTYRAVSKKLDSYSSLGYSSAGVVLEVGENVRSISAGDYVACAGMGYASHAEVIAVPENLCVKLSPEADLADAAYNTLGAIAMQGVRQADLRLGESCVVIGLGLLGQLTCLLLKAGGLKVFGLDIDNRAVEMAGENCADLAMNISDPTLAEKIYRATNGINADAVIITAATDSTEPINLAGKLLRKKGTVVVVGGVPTGFQREPDWYRKELSLKMSCSYGPGRYDLNYEEKGFDYPPGYVRWTENRNMQAFQELIQSDAIGLDYLTTHRYSIDEAPKAYDLILKQNEHYLGIIIEYDVEASHGRKRVLVRDLPEKGLTTSKGIGFIGAGSYAMSYLLPNLPLSDGAMLTGVFTSSSTSSRSVAEKFGFAYTAASAQDVIEDIETATVFIATRHDSHARYAQQTLKAGKNVFVEKPLSLNFDELNKVVEAWKEHQPHLMVGFNRRFSPLVARVKEELGSGPMSMLYRVNAGPIPSDTWIQDIETGGGRIIGEACHFIDLMIFINGSLPKKVYASALPDPSDLQDTVTINLTFENGSIGSICYFSNGPKSLAKEYIEVYRDGIVARVTDFKSLEILGGSKPTRKNLINQDKGQKEMVKTFLAAVQKGSESPIPLSELLASTVATFEVLNSLRSGNAVSIVMPGE